MSENKYKEWSDSKLAECYDRIKAERNEFLADAERHGGWLPDDVAKTYGEVEEEYGELYNEMWNRCLLSHYPDEDQVGD